MERASDREPALHAWLERNGGARLQADGGGHVAHVIGVVRVALDGLEDPPPVLCVDGVMSCSDLHTN